MAAKRTHDLMVAAGEYQNRQGETKKDWVNIGARLEWDDGGASLMIKRHINLAGFPGDGDVRVSMFEIKPRDGQQQQAPQQARNYSQPKQESAPTGGVPFDDDIPFMRVTGPW